MKDELDILNIKQIRFFVIWRIKQLREDEIFNCLIYFKELSLLSNNKIKEELIKIAENCTFESLVKMVSILFPYKIEDE
jgi:hypothetical protein